MLDIIGKRRYAYAVSLVIMVVGMVFILATLIPNGGVGLQFSIAYTGGTVWEVHFEDGTPDLDSVHAVLAEQELPGSEVAITGADDREFVLIRTEELSLIDAEAPGDPEALELASLPGAGGGLTGASDGPVIGVPTEGRLGALATALQDRFGPIDEVRQVNSVGPVVSGELVQQTFLLVIIASLAIMGYITYRFRDFRMGATAVVALVHDVIITVGAFALLGTFMDLQIDALFVTAILTVIGFSVHDTIVVFDRVRENRQRYLGEPMERIVGYSLNQTLGRSITTSLTIAITLMALLFFGGEAIRPFTLALLIGVIAGTSSSLFVATPLFLDWHLRDERRKAQQRTAQPSPA